MGELSPWHWIIVLLLFALLFGSKRLPDAARGLGRSMRIFKAEMQSARDEGAAAPVAPMVPFAAVADAVPVDAIPVDAVPVDAVPADTVPVDAIPVDVVPPVVAPEPAKPAVEH